MVVTVSEGAMGAASGVSRRDFLRFGGFGVFGLSASTEQAAAQAALQATGKGQRRCIFVLMTGGPSHIDTFDPKPHASAEFRGPFSPIATSQPGVSLAETLPGLAQRFDKFSLIRSLWHDATPVHETGQQLIQTGRLADGRLVYPSAGSMVSRLLGPQNDLPPYVVVPRPLGDTGVEMWQGQGSGCLGEPFEPLVIDPERAGQGPLYSSRAIRHAMNVQAEPEAIRREYGTSSFAQSCLLARRLVQHGVRFVTINMFDSLADKVTWDCHANVRWAPATLRDYRDTLCPDFDRGMSALLDDLARTGLLSETLVVATGEFGRTPRINEFGGRDHWPGAWSAMIAGGGVLPGTVIGGTDDRGTAPVDRPVEPGELVATVLTALGVDSAGELVNRTSDAVATADDPFELPRTTSESNSTPPALSSASKFEQRLKLADKNPIGELFA